MTDDTYTHRPGEVSEERGGRAGDEAESGDATVEDGETRSAAVESTESVNPDDEDLVDPAAPVERGREEWNWRDWLLVGVVVLCFLVIPATIIVIPPVRPFRFAYLVLPLIPAFVLGAVAVWSAQRSA